MVFLHNDIFRNQTCVRCGDDRSQCLSLVFRGNIVRLNSSSYTLIRSCLEYPQFSSGTGIFCRNCIASYAKDGVDDKCNDCSVTFVRIPSYVDCSCPNCRIMSIDPSKLPSVRANRTKQLLEETLGTIVDTRSTPIRMGCKFGTCLRQNFTCKRCKNNDPVTLDFCVYPQGKIALSKISREKFIECIEERHEKTGIFCNLCWRQLYGYDGSHQDTHYFFKTRYQNDRMKAIHIDFKHNCCEVCSKEMDETNLRCFQFDHIDPTNKHKAISTMVQDGDDEETIENELKKCRLICTNCHLRNTYNQGYSFHTSSCPKQLLKCIGRYIL